MAKRIVTLYIDDTSLRLMVTRGKRIKRWADLPLDMGLAEVGAAVKEAEVAAKVKQLFKSQKVRAKKVIVGLSGLHCLTRPLTLPLLPKAMLAEAVMREAKRVLPVPVEQLYISWQTVPGPEGKIQVFLVAIPRRIADAIIKLLKQVGLKPHIMDLKPMALARLVREPTVIIVDVQPTEFDIVIMSNGVPQPIRTIPFPGDGLSWEEKLETIKSDLERTIDFFNSNNPDKPLVPDVNIFVSGELADKVESHRSLSKELGHLVLPLISPLEYPEGLESSRYMTNIGLALKELEKETGSSVVNLNAVPAQYRPKPVPWAKLVALPAAFGFISLCVTLTILVQDVSAEVDLLRGQLDTTNHILTLKQTQKKELADNVAALQKKLTAAVAARTTFITALNGLDEQGEGINGDLQETNRALFDGVEVGRLSHGGTNVAISGSSASEVEILAYASRLDNSGRFPTVTISSISRVESADSDNGTMAFTLTLKSKGK